MGYGIKLRVWGDYACFTRPEMKAERVSYDVITPSAARGILEAIHWKPTIRWVIDRIHVLKPIRFENIRRNEVGGKIPINNVLSAAKGRVVDLHQYATEDRQQRASVVLRNVEYVIEAHFEMRIMNGTIVKSDETPEKHYNIFLRRARNGQCFQQPYLGCREFPAFFQLLEGEIPASPIIGEKDLGYMLWDMEFGKEIFPKFFRPVMKNGIIEVPDLWKEV